MVCVFIFGMIVSIVISETSCADEGMCCKIGYECISRRGSQVLECVGSADNTVDPIECGSECDENWVDNGNFNCEKYKTMEYCTEQGSYGGGWNVLWGTFNDYAVNGKSAIDICPQCGCGTSETTTPPPAECTCPNGTPLDSSECPEDGTVLCSSCNDGWTGDNCDTGIVCDVNWVDTDGESCNVYQEKNYCTQEGEYGDSWNVESWGPWDDYAVDGKSAIDICPQCGCGTSEVNESLNDAKASLDDAKEKITNAKAIRHIKKASRRIDKAIDSLLSQRDLENEETDPLVNV